MDDSVDDFRSVMASVDRQGRRRWLHVHLLAGAWRRRRQALALALIGGFLLLPHLSRAGLPMLLIDIPHRRYVVAGQVFWPQDLSYLLLFVLIAIIGTLLAVALAGRVFCGWLCPHNLLLELVYRPLERLLEGPAHRRARQDRGPRTVALALRKAAKWTAYLALSVGLAATCTALFTGPQAFAWGVLIDAGEHPAAATFQALLSAAILFDFAWFREQTCTIVCPYGRLQSAMLDPHSLVPAYDARRGEPRGKPAARAAPAAAAAAPIALDGPAPALARGDCVDCGLCVSVCPTGIDIRNGSQLECIHCAACIDACDGVMARLGRAKGLIAYRSENQLQGRPRRTLRGRTLLYAAVLLALVGISAVRIAGRSGLEAMSLRVDAMPRVELDAERREVVRQPLPLSLSNRTGEAQRLTLSLPAGLDAHLIMQYPVVELAPNQRLELTPIVDVPRGRFAAGDCATILVIASDRGSRLELPITLRAP
jgi:cytochrome c oxidase accessory protein FixG